MDTTAPTATVESISGGYVNSTEDDSAVAMVVAPNEPLGAVSYSVSDGTDTLAAVAGAETTDVTGARVMGEKLSGILTALPLSDSDHFGRSVARDGAWLAVGASGDDTGGSNRGAVYLINDSDGDGDFSDALAGDVITINEDTAGVTLGNGDGFGVAVALESGVLAVGGRGNDTGGSNRGAVWLIDDGGDDWATIASTDVVKLSSDTTGISLTNDDAFGAAIALDDGVVAVGTPGDNGGGSSRGAVYLIDDGDDGWGSVLAGDVTKISNDTAGITLANADYFGNGVALAGDVIVVGAPGDDTGGSGRGAVYILDDLNDDNDWADTGELVKLSDDTTGISLTNDDYFGYTVAVEGGVLAAGATQDDTGGSQRGAVYLIDGGGDSWGSVVAGDVTKVAHGTGGLSLTDSDYFGSGVALEDGALAAGAHQDDTGGSGRGAVYMFDAVYSFSGDIASADFEKDTSPTSGDGKLAAGATVTVTATPTDLAGNVGTAATGSFVYDISPPTFTGISESGTTLTATMSEDVWAPTAPDTGDFVITRTGGSAPSVSSLSGIPTTSATAGRSFTITLGTAAAAGDTLAYTQSGTDGKILRDAAGNKLASVSGFIVGKSVTISAVAGDDVINAAEDNSAVLIAGNSTDFTSGTAVTITVDDGDVDTTADLTFTAATGSDGSWTTGSGDLTAARLAALDEGTMTITANAAGANAATRTVAYDRTAPTVALAAVSGGYIHSGESGSAVTVSGTTTGADSGTTVAVSFVRGSATVRKDDLAVSGNAWSTSLSVADLTALGEGTISATAVATDAAGNPSATATRTVVQDLTVPTVSGASYNGSAITLVLSEPIAVSGTRTGADFTVSVTGASNPTVSSYTVSGTTVLLTLSSAIAENSVVSLSYALNSTAANRITDLAGNELAALSARSVVGKAITVPEISGGYINAGEDDAALTVSGTSVNIAGGTAVAVRFDGAGTDVVKTGSILNNAWSVSLTAAELRGLDAETPHAVGETITVTATADNISGTGSFIYDPVAPSAAVSVVAGDDVVNSVESGSAVTVSGTTVGADSGTTVAVSFVRGSTTVSRSDLAVSGNAWSTSLTVANLTALGEGAISVSAVATDAAGNASAAGTRTVVQELTAPTISSAFYNGSAVTLAMSEAVAVSGTKTGGDFTVSVTGASNPTVSSYTISGTTVTLTLSSAIAANSVVSLAYALNSTAANRITDSAGNPLAAVSSQSVSNKAVFITTPVSGDGFISAAEDDSSLSVSGTTINIADGTAIAVTFDGTGTDATAAGTVNSNAWSVSITAAQIRALDASAPSAAGETVTITATAAGISGTASFIYDPVAPVLTVGTVSGDDLVNTAESAAGVALSGTAAGTSGTVTLTAVNGTNTVTKTDLALTSGAWSASLTAAELTTLTDGVITLTAAADDTAGNTGTVSRTITRDTVAPAAADPALTGVPTGTSRVIALTVTVSGTDLTHYKHKTVAADSCATGTYSASTPVATDITTDISALPDGVVTLCLIARDTAGNWQSESAPTTASWTKDTTTPLNKTGAISGPTATKRNRTITLTGTTDSTPVKAGDYLTIEIGGTGSGPTATPGTRYGTTGALEADPDGAYQWSILVTGLPTGTHTLTARYYNSADTVSTDPTPATHQITVRSSGGGGSHGGGTRAPGIPGGSDDDGSTQQGQQQQGQQGQGTQQITQIPAGTPIPAGYVEVTLTPEQRATHTKAHNKTISDQIAALTAKLRAALSDPAEHRRIAAQIQTLVSQLNNPPILITPIPVPPIIIPPELTEPIEIPAPTPDQIRTHNKTLAQQIADLTAQLTQAARTNNTAEHLRISNLLKPLINQLNNPPTPAREQAITELRNRITQTQQLIARRLPAAAATPRPPNHHHPNTHPHPPTNPRPTSRPTPPTSHPKHPQPNHQPPKPNHHQTNPSRNLPPHPQHPQPPHRHPHHPTHRHPLPNQPPPHPHPTRPNPRHPPHPHLPTQIHLPLNPPHHTGQGRAHPPNRAEHTPQKKSPPNPLTPRPHPPTLPVRVKIRPQVKVVRRPPANRLGAMLVYIHNYESQKTSSIFPNTSHHRPSPFSYF